VVAEYETWRGQILVGQLSCKDLNAWFQLKNTWFQLKEAKQNVFLNVK